MGSEIMVFRTDWNDIDWIWSRIQSGSIHQGWGIPDTQLIENDEIVPLDVSLCPNPDVEPVAATKLLNIRTDDCIRSVRIDTIKVGSPKILNSQ